MWMGKKISVQRHLHHLLEHPETNMSWPDIEPGSPA
jgi:hypothetical protein